MELKDTIELMQSEDCKERFKAEYYQVRYRPVSDEPFQSIPSGCPAKALINPIRFSVSPSSGIRRKALLQRV